MHITQLDIDDKKQVDDFLRLLFSIYQDIPQRLPPLQTDEWLILEPKLVRLVMKNESSVGFLLAYPDISRALQKNRGRLFPLGC